MRSCFRSLLDQPQVHCVKRNKQDAESHCVASCVKSEKYWSFWDGGKWWFQDTGGADGRRHWGHNPDGCEGLESVSVLLKMRKTTVNNNTLCASKGQMRGCWRWFFIVFHCFYVYIICMCLSVCHMSGGVCLLSPDVLCWLPCNWSFGRSCASWCVCRE